MTRRSSRRRSWQLSWPRQVQSRAYAAAWRPGGCLKQLRHQQRLCCAADAAALRSADAYEPGWSPEEMRGDMRALVDAAEAVIASVKDNEAAQGGPGRSRWPVAVPAAGTQHGLHSTQSALASRRTDAARAPLLLPPCNCSGAHCCRHGAAGRRARRQPRLRARGAQVWHLHLAGHLHLGEGARQLAEGGLAGSCAGSCRAWNAMCRCSPPAN